MANCVVDPGVTKAVDGDGARREPDLELLGPTRIARGEARHGVGAAVGDPYPILLINGEMEGRLDLERAVHRLAIHGAAEDAPLAGVSLGQIDDLVLFIVERPDVAVRGGDDALHFADLAAEIVAGL